MLMRAPTKSNPQNTFELIENIETRDEDFVDPDGAWGTKVVRPPGKGWQPLPIKHPREPTTRWQRRSPVVPAPRRATRGGGGWLR
jgi:hypothetical protein